MLLKSDSVMTINALDCGLLNEIITSDGRKTYDRKPFTDVLSLFEKSNKEHLVIQCDPEKTEIIKSRFITVTKATELNNFKVHIFSDSSKGIPRTVYIDNINKSTNHISSKEEAIYYYTWMYDIFYPKIMKCLKEAIKLKGYTQEYIGKLIGEKNFRINRWKNEHIKASEIISLCYVLDISFDRLVNSLNNENWYVYFVSEYSKHKNFL